MLMHPLKKLYVPPRTPMTIINEHDELVHGL